MRQCILLPSIHFWKLTHFISILNIWVLVYILIVSQISSFTVSFTISPFSKHLLPLNDTGWPGWSRNWPCKKLCLFLKLFDRFRHMFLADIFLPHSIASLIQSINFWGRTFPTIRLFHPPPTTRGGGGRVGARIQAQHAALGRGEAVYRDKCAPAVVFLGRFFVIQTIFVIILWFIVLN